MEGVAGSYDPRVLKPLSNFSCARANTTGVATDESTRPSKGCRRDLGIHLGLCVLITTAGLRHEFCDGTSSPMYSVSTGSSPQATHLPGCLYILGSDGSGHIGNIPIVFTEDRAAYVAEVEASDEHAITSRITVTFDCSGCGVTVGSAPPQRPWPPDR